MNKATGGGTRQDGTPVIHWTKATKDTPFKRVKPICGQRSRTSYFGVVSSGEVNCEKCIQIAS